MLLCLGAYGVLIHEHFGISVHANRAGTELECSSVSALLPLLSYLNGKSLSSDWVRVRCGGSIE